MKDNKIEKIEKRIRYLKRRLNRASKHRHLYNEDNVGDIFLELEILEGKLEFIRGNYITVEEIFG